MNEYSTVLRRVLRWLWEERGAPKLDSVVPRHPGTRPRNVTATRQLIDRLVKTPDLALRMMILLCGDMAIRSGTAVKLGPREYNAAAGTLTFTTKMQEKLTLPVTESIRELIELCDAKDTRPFVVQLNNLYRRRDAKSLDVNTLRFHLIRLVAMYTPKRITFHDLRRTAAVRMYELTGDLRMVQALLGHRSMNSTIWYLDHDLRPINRETLEMLKQPSEAERKFA